jgi:hypothetical protein
LSTRGVIGWAAVATPCLAAVALLGLPLICAWLALVLAGGSLVLLLINWSAIAPSKAHREEGERESLIGAIAVMTWVGGLVPLAVIHGVVGEAHGHPSWLWRALAIDFTAVFGTFYLSSLTDWCYVVPRMKGLGDNSCLPCQTSTLGKWKAVTRFWLLHRIAAYLIGRIGLLTGMVLIAAQLLPPLSNSAISAIATVVAALLIFYLNRVIAVGGLVSNPPIQVGDKVVLAEEFGTGVVQRPAYYIVDVSIEGVKLLEVDGRDQPRRAGFSRGHDRTLNLADVSRLLRARERFEGCRSECCKANEYCPLDLGQAIEFDSKPGAAA